MIKNEDLDEDSWEANEESNIIFTSQEYAENKPYQ